MDYETESRGGYGDSRDTYDRDRSGSPRTRSPDGNTRMRSRSASPGGRVDSRPGASDTTDRRDKDPSPEKDGSRNTGTNLFVTGIHPRLSEEDITRLFGKYGEVIKCNIMVDPHTKESRGFGFVNFAISDQADAAKDALQGEVYEGRTLSIEKARRSRPRTPTPGKYFGPPKRAAAITKMITAVGASTGTPAVVSREERGGGGRSYYESEGRPPYEGRPRDAAAGAPEDRYAATADPSGGRGGDRDRGYYDRESKYSRH
ncbi:hypothetical protein DRE_02741 [Drechslerella stenobrocha 248]|uniref:RRM domain-containing protein n=1 Tax=Drechslerella stenobrocha 248 TaxID=1043628 RepID=W7HWE2_9PEZI|nr:hypothetical protein DRE_02741 [Drechslerella stenobrocha 248]